MTAPFQRLLLCAAAAAGTALLPAAESRKVTYEDDVLPIFRDNCLKCHNPDKLKGDLDLTSFSGVIKGGGSGATINAGDPDGSLLFKAVTHADEPTMPPNAKLSPREIGLIREWIAGGLLQGRGSQAIAANKPAADLSLKSASVGRPDGPPVLPVALSLDPVVVGERSSALHAIACSPWAPVVALSGTRQIVFHRTDNFEFAGVLAFPEGAVCDVKFSRNGRLLIAGGGRGGKSGAVAVWDVATAGRIVTIGDQYDSVLATDLSSDQRWIALGGPDKVLKIYRTKDGGLEHRLKKHTDWVTAVEYSPDSKWLASGDRTGGLVIWDAQDGHELFTLPGHKGAVTAISWRDDSQMFVSSGEDGTLKWWKATDGSAIRSLPAHAGGALATRFAHDGRVVSCGRDNKVQIWDPAGKNLQTLAFTGDLPNRVAFTDDGARVIGSDWQGVVQVWEIKGGKKATQLDANPPSLAARVQRDTDQIATLERDLATARRTLSQLTSESKAAAKAAEKARRAFDDAKSRAASDPDSAPSQKTIATLEASRKAAEQQVAGIARQLEESQRAIAALEEKLGAVRLSLERWRSAPRHATAPTATGRLTAR